MKLYRPVGKKELELIVLNKHQTFPPRLDWQPIFYPVLNFEYAAQIAKEWNTQDAFSGYCGFVTEFEVDDDFVAKYPVQNVGAKMHNELWVPSAELAEFMTHFIGSIEVSQSFYGEQYTGLVDATDQFTDWDAKAQFEHIRSVAGDKNALTALIRKEHVAVYVNYDYWQQQGFDKSILAAVKTAWRTSFSSLDVRKEL